MSYEDFLNDKIKLAEKNGFEIDPSEIHPILKPHQRDVVQWSIQGGCRATFASFGLGKTLMQLETLRLIQKHKGGNVLAVCPLGVRHEFANDAKKHLGIDKIKYITSTDEIEEGQTMYITNYERVRMGSIDPARFTAVCLDEASILRSLDSDTTETFMQTFGVVPFRFVHTATPAPNRYLELTHYADYLGIMDRGQILTRFFQRNSTSAGDLTLHENRKQEFWFWMSSWACFINKPSDLGHEDAGYALPPIEVKHHLVQFERAAKVDKKTRQATFVPDATKSLPAASAEKRDSLPHRVSMIGQILAAEPRDEAGKITQFIIWCHLNSEQKEIEKMLKFDGISFVSLTGSEEIEKREDKIKSWKDGDVEVFLSKPSMYGSGINMQQAHRMIFAGIDYKFQDFIQGVHRIFRFGQTQQVVVDVIYTDAEDEILKRLEQKWANHTTLQNEMTDIIQQYGLNSDLYQSELSRQMFKGRQVATGPGWELVNNDNVAEYKTIEDNRFGLIVTSIPFGNHYEYSDNYNCFGHNESNEKFFEQMDFLVPELYRTLQPGRIAAIHVKDRIRYSYMNGTGFSTIDPFSDDTIRCFRKHGFHLMARITVTTDVVQENNSTYRLGWTEACKDMTKMGAGLPEYVLLLRKPATDNSNAYADLPVQHTKENYTRARWQLDAHAYWKSAGDLLMDSEYLRRLDLSDVLKLWKELELNGPYNHERHVAICEKLEEIGKLPSTFMAAPPQSNGNPHVWDDITRMRTLNSNQKQRNLNKHICPLQLDLIQRCIERFSNPGEEVADPFNGIGSVVFQAAKMGRKGHGTELKTEYWEDSVRHVRSVAEKAKALTLFELFDMAV